MKENEHASVKGPLKEVMDGLDALAEIAKSCDILPHIDFLRRAIEHLNEHSERAHILVNCAINLVEAKKPMEVFQSTLNDAVKLTKAERGMILLWNQDSHSLEPVKIESEGNIEIQEDIEVCESLARKAFEEERVISSWDIEEGVCSLPGDSAPKAHVKSVLVAPMIAETVHGRHAIGVIYLDTRSKSHQFAEDDARLVKSFAALSALSLAHIRATNQLKMAYRETVEALVRAIEAKDKYTKGHSERVAELAVMCGRQMGLSEDRLTMLKSAALLHDVGKIGIRDSVLFKPGRLTKEEYEHIKLHADMSEAIVRGITFLDEEVEILAASQEHYDGTGYPRGTKGDEIPIEAYIIQVADAWDAMTSRRVYRAPLSKDAASAELRKFSGTQFHPEVVDAFLKMIESGKE